MSMNRRNFITRATAGLAALFGAKAAVAEEPVSDEFVRRWVAGCNPYQPSDKPRTFSRYPSYEPLAEGEVPPDVQLGLDGYRTATQAQWGAKIDIPIKATLPPMPERVEADDVMSLFSYEPESVARHSASELARCLNELDGRS